MRIENPDSKAKDQRHFKGVFAAAQKAQKEKNEDHFNHISKRRKF